MNVTNGNGNGNIRIPKWVWATIIGVSVSVLGVGAGFISWAGEITSKLAVMDARMAGWDRQTSLIDEIRSEQLRGGYTLYSMGDAQARLTKPEITLHRLEDDVKELLKRKL